MIYDIKKCGVGLVWAHPAQLTLHFVARELHGGSSSWFRRSETKMVPAAVLGITKRCPLLNGFFIAKLRVNTPLLAASVCS